MAKNRTRTGPFRAVVYMRDGDVRGVGGVYTVRSIRRGKLVESGHGTVYPSWAAAMDVARRYVAVHGGQAGARAAE